MVLEEIIRAIAEGKGEERSATVIAMLQARIGRLDSGPRRTLRAASVFGQTFWRGGVAQLLDVAPDSRELAGALDFLIDAEMIEKHLESRLADQEEYGFRHASLRDAAYSLLTDGDIETGHRLAADFLETAGEHDPAIIAEHCERGGARMRAVQHFIRAADLAAANNDLKSVLKRSERGIACGATGEALGILRSLQAAAHAWQDAWAEASACGLEAVPLLTAGSLRHCKLLNPLFLATSGANPPAFAALAAQFPSIKPEPAARSAYVEAAAWLAITFSMIGQRAPAAAFLVLVDEVSKSIAPAEAAVWAHMRMSQGFHARFLEADPWNCLQLFQAGTWFAEIAHDDRSLAFILCLLGSSQSDLGDAAAAEKTLRDCVALSERIQVGLAVTASALYLSLHLSRCDTPRELEEAVQLTRRTIATRSVSPFLLAQLHGILAHALMKSGALDEAEREARLACESLTMSITLRLQPVATLIQVLLRTSRIDEARALGERELAALEACGGVGYTELGFLLALYEARHAAGDLEAAQRALSQACDRLQLRVDRIPEPAAQQRFVEQVFENRRIRELEARWLAAK